VVGAAGLRVRAGSTIDFTVDWADVDTVSKSYRSLPSSKSVQVEQEGDRTVLNIVTGGQTSVDVRLRQPVSLGLPKGPAGSHPRRETHASSLSEPADELRVYADDPDGFVRACRQAAAADHAIMRHAQEG
jgi:hypothetical protein